MDSLCCGRGEAGIVTHNVQVNGRAVPFRASRLNVRLDEAATRRKSGGNGSERFTLSAAPDLACGRILINRCDLAGERGLHIDREP